MIRDDKNNILNNKSEICCSRDSSVSLLSTVYKHIVFSEILIKFVHSLITQ